MSTQFEKNVFKIQSWFASTASQENKYNKIIEFGKELKSFPDSLKTEKYLVKGCQSLLYLETTVADGRLYFNAHSEALISKGLAGLLVEAYSGLTPEEILKSPPDFLKELGIQESLSPNRANGLFHMHLRIKQEALAHLINQI